MVGAPSGGQMEVGTKDNFEMECRVDLEFCIEMEGILNMRGLGIMECLMEKELSISKMGKSMKDLLNRTNSMVMGYFIKTIPLSTECGKIINYQL